MLHNLSENHNAPTLSVGFKLFLNISKLRNELSYDMDWATGKKGFFFFRKPNFQEDLKLNFCKFLSFGIFLQIGIYTMKLYNWLNELSSDAINLFCNQYFYILDWFMIFLSKEIIYQFFIVFLDLQVLLECFVCNFWSSLLFYSRTVFDLLTFFIRSSLTILIKAWYFDAIVWWFHFL